MALDNHSKEKIAIEVIKTLISKFTDFPDEEVSNRNAPFHEAFLKAFAEKFDGKVTDAPILISLSSWLQGLNTRLGQSFFEKVAHFLCDGQKREYTSKKLGNLPISQKQRENVTKIITELSNKTASPNLAAENSQLFQKDKSQSVNAIDFSADVFFERENDIIAIELKTVQPNSGGSMGEKQKILEGKAALYHLFPDRQIHFYLGFPFDPTVNPETDSVTSGDKTRFLRSIINIDKFFDPQEILLAGDLWDFLSEQSHTMESILEIINIISTTSFLDKFQLLNDNSQRQTEKYKKQLLEWNLFSELELIEKDSHIRNSMVKDKKLQKTYNKMPFDNQGNYQWERFHTLVKLLDHSSRIEKSLL
jgi:hypothetical protein